MKRFLCLFCVGLFLFLGIHVATASPVAAQDLTLKGNPQNVVCTAGEVYVEASFTLDDGRFVAISFVRASYGMTAVGAIAPVPSGDGEVTPFRGVLLFKAIIGGIVAEAANIAAIDYLRSHVVASELIATACGLDQAS